MSALTTSPAGGAGARTGGPAVRRGPTFPRVVASEWTKLTSLRSTAVIAVATVVVSWALTYLAANASSVDPGFVPLDSLTAGLLLAQVGPLVLGILVGTGDFTTGTFRSTFTAVPRRLPVLAAQVVAVGASALVVAAASVVAAVVALVPAASSRGIPLDLTGDGTPQVLVGMAAFLVAMALLGLAVGALLRSPVPAVALAVVLVLVLPVVLSLGSDLATDPMSPAEGTVSSQQSLVNTVVTFLPSGAADLLVRGPGGSGIEGAPDLGPWGGALVLVGWVLVPLAVAAVRLRARDVV
ncbi:ABC transporter permease subunit [Oerskovia sp. NPDC057915]|uniref:ABC transporter permease subunit n=1 Tax=Oerskovia sp. NPDC057915 TaxID=3346280 RepID=UPI0036DC8F16